jgi:KipI family sensor histidine kinase inhibitor
MSSIAVRRCGERAFLIEAPDNASVHVIAERALGVWPGLEDVVAGHETVLLAWSTPGEAPEPHELEAALSGTGGGDSPGERPEVVIPTLYGGEDLTSLALETGLSEEAIVAVHSGTSFIAAFTGFAPGFAYLLGLPPELQVPRLDEPRTRVPAGSVAIAGEYSAVYPTASPGGWRLIGRTEAVMFDPSSERPALIEPGAIVRFVQVPR